MYSNPEIGKHVFISEKQKIIGVENVKDNDEDINQFEEMLLFTNPMNIKHMEKEFDNNFISYMRKGLYENYVSHFILMLIFVCMNLNLYHII
jgi:hypothetical protein